MMTWSLFVRRRELMDLLGDARPLNCPQASEDPLDTIRPPVGSDEVCLLWDHNPTEGQWQPGGIAVDEDFVDDFLAWASTYLKGYTPFTAYFRVATWENFVEAAKENSQPEFDKHASACVGAIVGEALTRQATKSVESLQWRSLTTTFSFCLSRAFATKALSNEFETLSSRWFRTASICGDVKGSPQNDLIDVWTVLRGLRYGMALSETNTDTHLSLMQACAEIAHKGELSDSLIRDVSGNKRMLTEAHHDMRGSREDRVTTFRRLVSEKLFEGIQPPERDFLCGYFANRIGPGSLSHSSLLTPISEQFPLAAMWYCVCAGLRPENDLLKAYDCLGRKLIRDASVPESILGSPRCDIAFQELDVLARADNPNWNFRRTSQAFLAVEVWPRVVAYLNWQPKGVAGQMALFGTDAKAPDATEIQEAMRSIQRGLEILGKTFGEAGQPRRKSRRNER